MNKTQRNHIYIDYDGARLRPIIINNLEILQMRSNPPLKAARM